jgi:hypothetical protein
MTNPRAWKLLLVRKVVYCSSTGHYFFKCLFDRNGQRVPIEYCSDGHTSRAIPRYALAAIERTIGGGYPDYFQVYEIDREGNRRYEGYRYHDPAYFQLILKGLKREHP